MKATRADEWGDRVALYEWTSPAGVRYRMTDRELFVFESPGRESEDENARRLPPVWLRVYHSRRLAIAWEEFVRLVREDRCLCEECTWHRVLRRKLAGLTLDDLERGSVPVDDVEEATK